MLGLRVARPLANYQPTRGLATLKDIRGKLNSVKNIQTGTQSMNMASFSGALNPEVGYKALRAFKRYLPELAPPTPAEIPRAIRDLRTLFKERSNWKNVTVREAWLNALVTTEVICWFFVGECIGKRTLIGYQV